MGSNFTRSQEGDPEKPLCRAKPSEVIQREGKSLFEFHERLYEDCILYTPIDPEAAASQMVINAAFAFQAYPENVRQGDTK